MPHPNPNKFTSIQEYLDALGFTTIGNMFVCGEIRFPQAAICGHTVSTFVEKMKEHGWMPPEGEGPIKWPFR
jgi:hypothetical protein